MDVSMKQGAPVPFGNCLPALTPQPLGHPVALQGQRPWDLTCIAGVMVACEA